MTHGAGSNDISVVPSGNADPAVIAGFGDEWSRLDQGRLSESDRERIFQDYFARFPWSELDSGARGADIGCGSGRWALLVAPRVGCLHCVDASAEALDVARRNLADIRNVEFHLASVDHLPFADASLDFAYSLGVLHHVPDTRAAIVSIARKLKPGAVFLLYLYYAFDNRPWWYRSIWLSSELLRRTLSKAPSPVRYAVSQALAGAVYWPLARCARLLESIGHLPTSWPLAYYRDKQFYVMRTDALDRFGTRLEQRFTRDQIRQMLVESGFRDVEFSDPPPYWCVVARRQDQARVSTIGAEQSCAA